MRAIEFNSRSPSVGREVKFEEIIKRYIDSERIELYKKDSVVLLNIRFDEVFHRCTRVEWAKLVKYLENQRVEFKKCSWWEFWV